MEPIQQQHYRAMGERAVKALEKRHFAAMYVETAEEAAQYVLAQVEQDMTIGFGGSMTNTQSLDLPQRIAAKGGQVMNSFPPPTTLQGKIDDYRKTILVDLYLSSTNALTMQGELVNIDGLGNRVAALSFGPKKTVVVAGVNKLCEDEAHAWARLKQTAAPRNNIRLSTPNPCVKTGVCVDCASDARICRSYSVLRYKPAGSDFTVVLVGEDLGY